jgi:shikimate kinase
MGTGKSSVGPLVAKRMGWHFIDCDNEIVARLGKPIPQIFADEGEARFRQLEREVIARVADDRHRCPQCHGIWPEVIATGGGALLDTANCEALKRTAVVICLTARPEVIAARVQRSKAKRPKLLEGGKPPLERIKELIEQRKEAYERADVRIDTSDDTIEMASERVIAEFRPLAAMRCVPSA